VYIKASAFQASIQLKLRRVIMKFLTLLSAFVVASASKLKFDVDNGERLTKEGEAPYQAVLDQIWFGYYCEGAIIHSRIVLTAAFCIEG